MLQEPQGEAGTPACVRAHQATITHITATGGSAPAEDRAVENTEETG